mmetsp:Transcript_32334/g.48782  ORF Transcript_32334/g.48782 Transcript_32334/m.48782 type:complete len:246 (-) Transcript_32334:66-803(-)
MACPTSQVCNRITMASLAQLHIHPPTREGEGCQELMAAIGHFRPRIRWSTKGQRVKDRGNQKGGGGAVGSGAGAASPLGLFLRGLQGVLLLRGLLLAPLGRSSRRVDRRGDRSHCGRGLHHLLHGVRGDSRGWRLTRELSHLLGGQGAAAGQLGKDLGGASVDGGAACRRSHRATGDIRLGLRGSVGRISHAGDRHSLIAPIRHILAGHRKSRGAGHVGRRGDGCSLCVGHRPRRRHGVHCRGHG